MEQSDYMNRYIATCLEGNAVITDEMVKYIEKYLKHKIPKNIGYEEMEYLAHMLRKPTLTSKL